MYLPTCVPNAALAASPRKSTRGTWLFVLLMFSLWDFYVPGVGIRPFDLIGCLGIGLYLLLSYAAGRQMAVNVWAVVTCLTTVMLVWYAGMRGVANSMDNVRPAVGMLAGTFVLGAVCVMPLSLLDLRGALVRCIAIHIFFFWLQFGVFFSFGELLEYHAILGASARVFAGVFRASGLALEPAHFALTMFMLLSLYIVTGAPRTGLLVVGGITTIASLSVWGLFAAVFLFTFSLIRTAKWWLGIAIVIVMIVVLSQFGSWWQELWLLERVMNLTTDSSALARYGGLMAIGSDAEWSVLLFGAGISNEYLSLGSSGAAFSLRSFGVLGSLALFGLLLITSLPTGGRRVLLVRALLLAFALSAAPIWTCMMWWAWIALVVRGTTLASGSASDL